MAMGNGFALFCEDVREEMTGQSTFVGVYGPFLKVKALPTKLRQLCIVVRCNGDETNPFESLKLDVTFPNDEDPLRHIVSSEDIPLTEQGEQRSETANDIILDGRYVFRSVAISRPGRIVVDVTIGDGAPSQLGFLEIVLEDDAKAADA